jgi:hypothetical protein
VDPGPLRRVGRWGWRTAASATKETHEVKIGSFELSVKDEETVNVPIWAGVGAIVVGGRRAQPRRVGKSMRLMPAPEGIGLTKRIRVPRLQPSISRAALLKMKYPGRDEPDDSDRDRRRWGTLVYLELHGRPWPR